MTTRPDPPRPRLEVCVDSVEGAEVAVRAGADRLELCAALGEGGLTPSLGQVDEVLARVDVPVVVLLRPRRGDFVFDAGEHRAQLRDLEHLRTRCDVGLLGVALGSLTADRRVDRAALTELRDAAGPLELTFHRAFDSLADLDAGLDALLELGVRRLLSSGGAADAEAGAEVLARLVARAGERLEVMPGGGLHAGNGARVAARTGARWLHLSAGRTVDGAPDPTGAGAAAAVPLARPDALRDDQRRLPDPELLAALRRSLGDAAE